MFTRCGLTTDISATVDVPPSLGRGLEQHEYTMDLNDKGNTASQRDSRHGASSETI